MVSLGAVAMEKNDDTEEQVEDRAGRSGVFDRARAQSAPPSNRVSRSAEVLSGSDIRRFDEFTDATTRAVVGVHRDQADLREHLADMDRRVEELRQEQLSVAARLEATEQSVRDMRQQQSEFLQRVDESPRSEAESLSLATIAFGIISAVALLLSIAAIVVSMS